MTSDGKTADLPVRPRVEPSLLAGRFFDTVIFAGILIFSALAVVVVAVSAPIALVFSALTSLFGGNRDSGRWRQAGA